MDFVTHLIHLCGEILRIFAQSDTTSQILDSGRNSQNMSYQDLISPT